MCELYPGEFEAMEHNGRMDAIEPMYYPQVDGITPTVVAKSCDDCISRQAVLGCLTATKLKEIKKYDLILHARKEIKNLPLVTPKNTVSAEDYKQVMWERDIAIQQLNELGYEFGEKIKTGKWNLEIEDWNKWICSECGWEKRTDIHVRLGYKYCPSCGSRMVELQERG